LVGCLVVVVGHGDLLLLIDALNGVIVGSDVLGASIRFDTPVVAMLWVFCSSGVLSATPVFLMSYRSSSSSGVIVVVLVVSMSPTLLLFRYCGRSSCRCFKRVVAMILFFFCCC
jgi:hypothetical protein